MKQKSARLKILLVLNVIQSIADTSYSFKGVNAFKHESVKPSYKKDLEALKYQIEALEKNISKIKFWKTSHYFGKSKP